MSEYNELIGKPVGDNFDLSKLMTMLIGFNEAHHCTKARRRDEGEGIWNVVVEDIYFNEVNGKRHLMLKLKGEGEDIDVLRQLEG